MPHLTPEQIREKKIKQYLVKNYYQDLPQNSEVQRKLVSFFYPRLYAQGKGNKVPTQNACRERVFQVARKIWKEVKIADFSDFSLDEKLLLDTEAKSIMDQNTDLGETVGKYMELNWRNEEFITAFKKVIHNPNYFGYRPGE
ncbi:MAG: hypothetical protein PHD81_01660 [Candidatus Nanoarchaeia archaeon]|nr:hypothetical protein [Candidatus Nanoarchaeia archaeon]MDD5587795.1 hypothetical protein [Candidatus Nanoarchaeia archaeon]